MHYKQPFRVYVSKTSYTLHRKGVGTEGARVREGCRHGEGTPGSLSCIRRQIALKENGRGLEDKIYATVRLNSLQFIRIEKLLLPKSTSPLYSDVP